MFMPQFVNAFCIIYVHFFLFEMPLSETVFHLQVLFIHLPLSFINVGWLFLLVFDAESWSTEFIHGSGSVQLFKLELML